MEGPAIPTRFLRVPEVAPTLICNHMGGFEQIAIGTPFLIGALSSYGDDLVVGDFCPLAEGSSMLDPYNTVIALYMCGVWTLDPDLATQTRIIAGHRELFQVMRVC